jgi:uncharacterized membrane protein
MTKKQLFLRIFLALHLTGLVLMAGTTTTDYLTFNTFCRLADQAGSYSPDLLILMSRYGIIVRTGAILLIFTGIGMLVLSNKLWRQPWFWIKLALVLTLIFHGMFAGNPQGQKFRALAIQKQPLAPARANLDKFYVRQLTLFFLVICVSVTRPGNFSTLAYPATSDASRS